MAGTVGVGPVRDVTGGYRFDPDSLAMAAAYAGPNGAVSTITVGPDDFGFSYRQTYTYTGNDVASISGWVKQ